MLDPEFVDQLGDFDVVAAVLGDLREASFLEPSQGLQAIGGFLGAEGRGGDGIEGEPVVEDFVKFDEEIEGGELGEVEDGVAVEDLVIEADMVEADDEVGAAEFLDEVVDLRFPVDAVAAADGAEGDPETEAHVTDLVPAADLLGGLLGFEVEVDDVLHGWIAAGRMVGSATISDKRNLAESGTGGGRE